MRRKTVIPAPRIRGGKLRRESKAYRRGTKSAINYVHLLSLYSWQYHITGLENYVSAKCHNQTGDR